MSLPVPFPLPTARAAARVALLLLALCGLAAPARAQLSFKPLERGDVKEYDQKLVVVQDSEGHRYALELGGDFSIRMRGERAKELAGLDDRTQFDEDFRLRFRTWFHQDVAMTLVLQTVPSGLDDSNLRNPPVEDRGTLTDGKSLALSAREAYLLYNINPNSHLLFGKQEVTLGDRRGKVFDGLAPAAQFNCRVGTWCMPFGAVKIGPDSADWIYHWALEYRAWDDVRNNMRDALEVEIFRILYTEFNVPLGKNLGPGYFDKTAPETATASQVTDTAGNPIYYDASHQNYLGLRVNWLSGSLFANLDYASEQGDRRYHRYRFDSGGILGSPVYAGGLGDKRQRELINGYTYETEAGYRWLQGALGLRFMTASGDTQRPTDNGQAYLRVLNGYHEITPGSYRGTRLYFNGTDSTTDLGGGLGHSVNNTTLTGIYLDMDYPDDKKIGYSAGIYDLRRNRAVANADGKLKSNIGLEWDNMLTWHVHKALRLQIEANLLRAEGAFAIDDFTTPGVQQNLLVQGILRLVYQF